MSTATLSLPALYRAHVNPMARRTASVAIVGNGSCRRTYGCVCGATHSESAKYRMTKHSIEWRAGHRDCMARAVAAALPGTMACLVA